MTKSKALTWNCADGRVLKVTEMEIGHLINTFHFIKRRARDEYRIYITRNRDEQYNVSIDKFCGAVWPIYIEMRKEIANRLRKMKKDSIERKYWHMKFSNDSKSNKFEHPAPEDAVDWDYEHAFNHDVGDRL